MKDKDITVQNLLDFIKVPTEFDALHDLKQVSEAANVARELLDNLDEFYSKYTRSFFRNSKEVLKYIPENQWPKYLKNMEADTELPFDEYLEYINKNSGAAYWDKSYIVDTKKKKLINFECGRNRSFAIDYKKQHLVMLEKYENHCWTSRCHDQTILSAHVELFVFCIKTNKFIKKETYGLGKNDHASPAKMLINGFMEIKR